LRSRSKVLEYVTSLLEVAGCFVAYATIGYPALALLVFPLLILVRNSYIKLISAVSYSLALTMLVSQPTAYLISILTASMSTAYFILYSGEREVLKPVYTLVLVLAPVYLVSPKTILVALASITSLTLPVVLEYYRLSKSRVTVFLSNPTTYLNDYVNVVVGVECPGSFKYYVEVGNELYCEKTGVNQVLENVRIRAKMLGVGRQSIKVVVEDLRHLARVEHGPHLVEYTVTPKFAELYRRAERVLAEYSRYISPPIIAKLTIQLTPLSTKEVSDLLTPQPGSTGVASTLLATTPESKYYVERAGIKKTGDIELLEKYLPLLAVPMIRRVRFSLKSRFEVKIVWKVPRKIMERVIQAARGYLGEYLGVREYTPGDSLRLIHWKKSARRSDVIDLVVKVYSASDVEKHSHPSRSIVVADLTATNIIELDLLLQTLYSYILSSIESQSRTPSEFYLYLITPRGDTYFLRGKAIDVLLGLNTIVLEEKLTALYDYTSWFRPNPPVTHAPEEGFLRELTEYFEAYGAAVARDLKTQGVERGVVVLIHSKALNFKYYVISSVFTRYGFAVTAPGISRE